MTKQVIICVDDETIVLRSLKAELREVIGDDCLIEIAESGREALELLEELLENDYEIPLIISDYIMPDMKGDELLKRVHKLSPKTLKVMLTGQANLEAVSNAVNYARLYRYITKPWQSTDLQLTVQEAIYSFVQDKSINEKRAKLQTMNQELEELTRKQAVLIAELQQNEKRLKQFTEELFKLNESFSRFVPRQFLQYLDKETIIDVQLGDNVQQQMSVLFSDIRDFTKLSENMTPEENFKFINAYLSRMEPAIIDNQGFVDKYIGDGIMALFSGGADNAIRAGIAMIRQLAKYNKYRIQSGYSPIKIGIGINTGSLMLGTVGGKNRMDTTVISDDVNLASRLETLTKEYGVSMLISHQTLSCLHNPGDYCIRFIAQLKVKGKSRPVAVFEVFDGDQSPIQECKLATKAIFEEGLLLYYRQDFREAARFFKTCLSRNPVDSVAQIYLERCQSREAEHLVKLANSN